MNACDHCSVLTCDFPFWNQSSLRNHGPHALWTIDNIYIYRQYVFPFAGKVRPCVTHRPTKNMPLLCTMLVYIIIICVSLFVGHDGHVFKLFIVLFAVPRNASKLGQIVFTPLRIWCCRHLQDHVGNLLPREVYAGHLGKSQPWWNLMEGLMFMAYTRWLHESLVCSIHPLRPSIQDMLRLHCLAHIPLGQIETQLQTSHNWLQERRTVGLRDVGRFPFVHQCTSNQAVPGHSSTSPSLIHASKVAFSVSSGRGSDTMNLGTQWEPR